MNNQSRQVYHFWQSVNQSHFKKTTSLFYILQNTLFRNNLKTQIRRIILELLEIHLLSCQCQFISFLSAEREVKSNLKQYIIFTEQSILVNHWIISPFLLVWAKLLSCKKNQIRRNCKRSNRTRRLCAALEFIMYLTLILKAV